MRKMRQEDDLISFFKKFCIRSKPVVSTLVLIYFGRHLLGYTVKANCIIFEIVDPDMLNFDFFLKKSVEVTSSADFVRDSSRKGFLMFYTIS